MHILSCVTPQDVVDTKNLYQFQVKLEISELIFKKLMEERVCKGLLDT